MMELFDKNIITSSNYEEGSVVKYFKNNNHLYICSSKVGSSSLKNGFLEKLDIPIVYLGKNISTFRNSFTHTLVISLGDYYLFRYLSKKLPSLSRIFFLQLEKYRIFYSKTKMTFEKDRLLNKKVMFLVRNPFFRAISSYEYRKNPRFNDIKIEKYNGIDSLNVDNMNIVQYTRYINNEDLNGNYNSLIEHSRSQKKQYLDSCIKKQKISLLWETSKLKELFKILKLSFSIDTSDDIYFNKNIKKKEVYFNYYENYPELFDVVKDVYKKDIEWLIEYFSFEEDFLKEFEEYKKVDLK